jgi:membrane-associated phospholipid phosphatase
MTVEMTTYSQSGSRRLPRGWKHLTLNILFWLGFYVVYQIARGLADRDVTTAFWNGLHVIRIEQWTGTLFEPTVQGFVDSSELLIKATTYTYWLSQFVVVAATLLWVYFRHHDRFAGFRNWIILANIVGLVCYVAVPTAPPRMFPAWGFVDTLAQYSGLNHASGLIAHTANPYAAMPSLHSMDSFIVGIVMFSVCRSLWSRIAWLLWPVWVWFSVIGTGNHYWLDVLAGVGIAILTAGAIALVRRMIDGHRREISTA